MKAMAGRLAWAVACAAAGTGAAARAGDEIDRLVEQVKPPARFKGYHPKWVIKPVVLRGCDQSKRIMGGRLRQLDPNLPAVVTIVTRTHMLMDGERYVGEIRNGCFTWYTGSPAENINELLDFDNWIYQRAFDIDLPMGPNPRSWSVAFEQGARGCRVEGGTVYMPDRRLDAKIEGDIVTWAWSQQHTIDEPNAPGIAQPQTGTHKVGKPTARAVHKATVRVDPVLGYVVEHSVRYETNYVGVDRRSGKPAFAVDYGSFFPHGNTNPWAKYQQKYSYAWQFYTPAAKGDIASPSGKPFGAWRANGISIDNVRRTRHCFVRGNGLVGYLKDPAGWGLALTKPENPADHYVAVCPAYGEFYMTGPLPQTPDRDGFYRLNVTRRCTGLPPEICDYIVKNAYVRFEGAKALQICLGGEDFETQPLPYTTPVNAIGYSWQNHPAAVSDKEAHSGRCSLAVKGVPYETITKSFPKKEVPPARFDPKARYRLECRIKVVGADTEAWVSIHMAGQTRDRSAIGRYRTESVTAGDWKYLKQDFTMPPDGLAVILGFVCVGGGTAYFDDFKLEELAPG